jgi:WD40 repeat protein
VAFNTRDGPTLVLDTKTQKEVLRLPPHEQGVFALAFNATTEFIARGSSDATRIVAIKTGKEVARLTHNTGVRALNFSWDGRYVAMIDRDQAIRVLEIASANELVRFPQTSSMYIQAVTFSPEGRYLATGSADKIARLFDIKAGKEIARLMHEDPVWALAFSPDGHYLATGSRDKTARIFESRSGKELVRLDHEHPVAGVSFSLDARELITISIIDAEGRVLSVRRHFLYSEDLITEACSRLTRNLTLDEWKRYLDDTPYRKTCPHLPCPSNMKTDAKGYCIAQKE